MQPRIEPIAKNNLKNSDKEALLTYHANQIISTTVQLQTYLFYEWLSNVALQIFCWLR